MSQNEIPTRAELNAGHKKSLQVKIGQIKKFDLYKINTVETEHGIKSEVFFISHRLGDLTLVCPERLTFKNAKSKLIKFLTQQCEDEIAKWEAAGY